MAITQDKDMWRRMLWLIYAEEAKESYDKSVYPKGFLYMIKRKVSHHLEQCEKNEWRKKNDKSDFGIRANAL